MAKMNRLTQFFQHHFDDPNYLYFLISLILMLILPSLAPLVWFGDIFLTLAYGLVILMACIFTSKSYHDLLLLGVLGLIAFVLFQLYSKYQFVTIINPIATLSFFGLVFIRLMQFVFLPKAIEANDIFALTSGYLLLGVIASPFFFVLDMLLDNAFSIPKGSNFYDLLYFSYITITGVGFGDIVPIHPLAKSLTLIVGISGQLYLAILVGIIIGKFLAEHRE